MSVPESLLHIRRQDGLWLPSIKPPYSPHLSLRKNYAANQDCVACWLLNEAGGNEAYDISGNRNDGVLTNGPAWSEEPEGGGSIVELDGSNEHILVERRPSLNITGDKLTLRARIKSAGTFTANNTFIWKGRSSNSNQQYALRGESDHKAHFYIYDAAAVSIASTTSIDDQDWHDIVGVYDGTNLHIYVDGVSDATPVAHTGDIDSDDGSKGLGIGAKHSGAADPFSGSISLVSIYAASLAPADVRDRYNNRYSMVLMWNPAWWFVVAPPTGSPYYYQQLIRRRYAA